MPRVAILTPDQQRQKPKAASATTTKPEDVPERLFLFDVPPPPATNPPEITTSQASTSQPQPNSTSWPFPLILPGTGGGKTAASRKPVTISSKQGLGYEYGPEIYLDDAGYWSSSSSTSPSSTLKKSRNRKSTTKKEKKKKEKLCPTNGYQNPLHRSTPTHKRVQVKASYQTKRHTTMTKEYLPGGGVKRVWVTHVTIVEVEEEKGVDGEGKIVEEGDDGEEGGEGEWGRREGEVDVEIGWSDEEGGCASGSSEDSEDEGGEGTGGKKSKGKGKAKRKEKSKISGQGTRKKHLSIESW